MSNERFLKHEISLYCLYACFSDAVPIAKISSRFFNQDTQRIMHLKFEITYVILS